MKISGNSQHKSRSDCTESTQNSSQPLEKILQQAGLVSSERIKFALDKQEREPNRRLGEILIAQGYLKPETVDFFAKHWLSIAKKPPQPLGQYFKAAGLLDESQIKLILYEQEHTKLKFGELAVIRGWIDPATLDFFIEHFASSSQSPLPGTKEKKIKPDSTEEREIHRNFSKIRLRLFGLNEDSFPLSLLDEIMWWTEGQFCLTQKLCQLVAESNIGIGGEKQVEQLVRTRLIENWQQGIAAEHLRQIRDRLLHNRQCSTVELLSEYRLIYQQPIGFGETKEQIELIDLELVKEERGKLRVSNPIYREVFDLTWIERHLDSLFQLGEIVSSSEPDEERAAPMAQTNILPPTKSKRTNRLGWLFLLIFTGLLGVGIPYIIQRWQVRTLFLTSTKLLTSGKYQQALAGYNKLLNLDSNYYQAWTNRGYALSGLKKYEQMLASCSSATLIEPEAIYAWNCRGEALHNLQRNAEALEAFERAIEIAPDDSIFFINKSESLLALGQYDGAIAASERAIEILEARRVKLGRNRDKLNEELAIAWNYQAKGLLAQQKYQLALAAYNRSLEYAAEYFPALIGKGITLINLQKYPQASAVFADILRNDELSQIQQAETWFYLGKTLCNSSQAFSGIAAFERAIELKPDYEAAEKAKANCQ